MSTLDRYRKSGGFVQLLQLLESSNKQKQEQFLGLISQESKAWEDCLRKKMLNIERVLSWSPEHLTEVFKSVPPITIGTALHGFPDEKIKALVKFLGHPEQRKINEVLLNKVPSQGEKAVCFQRIIQETRNLMTRGILKVEKFDPDLAISPDIEYELNSIKTQGFGHSTPTNEGEGEDGTALRFELSSESKNPLMTKDHKEFSKDDVDQLKKKIQSLAAEVNSLKTENAQMRLKLEQIRRIA